MISVVYYDRFADEYVLEEDPLSPPERYLKTCRGEDMYKEAWITEDGKTIEFQYTSKEFDKIYKTVEKENHVKLRYRKYWAVPSDQFDAILKWYCLGGNKE